MNRVIKLVTAAFLIIGTAMLVGGGLLALRTRAFLERAQPAAGTVTRLDAVERTGKGNRRGVYYYPIVSFELPTGGSQEIRGSSGSNPPAWTVGEPVEVLYDPARPSDGRIRSFSALWLGPVILAGMGLVFAIVGALMFVIPRVKGRRAAALRQKGTRVQAVLQSVEKNGGLKVNGRSPWRILCQWTDPATRQLHVFESDNLWFDPTSHIREKEITVFIEPGNPRRYAVDLSFLPKLAE